MAKRRSLESSRVTKLPIKAAKRVRTSASVDAAQLGQLVDLSEARHARRLTNYRAKLERVVKANKLAIGKLYLSGAIFTRLGTRAGRDLLLAHEHLLRVVSLLDRLGHQGDVPAPRRSEDVDAIFAELDTLLDRTTELTEHTAEMMGELAE